MAKITNILGATNYEIVRTKIAAILAIELANQVEMLEAAIALNPAQAILDELTLSLESIPYEKVDNDVVITVWMSRFLRPNLDEFPVLNVVFTNSPLDENVTHSTAIGEAGYLIECWQNSESTEYYRGDSRAAQKLDRLLGICMHILNDRNYKYLELEGIVGYSRVKDIMIAQPKDGADNNSTPAIYGTLSMGVKIPETSPEYIGALVEGTDASMSINSDFVSYRFNSTLI